jgi:RND family efflux transporter MFP subunit
MVAAWAEAGLQGITAPVTDATLSAEVAGRIAKVAVEEGTGVTNNQVLVELDRDLEELEVERRRIVWESRAEVDSAAARVQTVQAELAGTRRLFESTRSVSKEELEQKILEHKLAVAEHERLSMLERREELEYRMALQQLARREIRSPTDGVVVEVHAEEGEYCEQGQPVLRVVDVSRCHFNCNVEEAAARVIESGRRVRLELTGGLVRTADVVYVAPVVDPASGLQEVKAAFDNSDGSVRPGVTGALHLE